MRFKQPRVPSGALTLSVLELNGRAPRIGAEAVRTAAVQDYEDGMVAR